MAKPLTKIGDAKAIAQRIGADAVVVLAFKDGAIHAASYGATKEKCSATGAWLDMIVDRLGDGTLRSPLLEKGPQ